MIDKTNIFKINCEADFNHLALEIFHYQYRNNSVYRDWVNLVCENSSHVKSVNDIPFLPIEFFKEHNVTCFQVTKSTPYFESSGTTSQNRSKHYYKNLELYKESFLNAFRYFFGEPKNYCFLALLPGYIERPDSSLIYMCNELISKSGHPKNGFYLDNHEELISTIEGLKKENQKTILIGVSYALIDLAYHGITLNENFIVMETGGMKGQRREMVKEELHEYLKEKFGVDKIAGEYGMTELFSQAYSSQDGEYKTPPWMKILIRDVNDPLSYLGPNKTGGVNIIDLANIETCSFIATKDLARFSNKGSFNLLGRYDDSDIRGCNLLLA